ncbi:hypothetical protein GA0061099_10055 [Bradyrhizobium yuanmingense]|uniref:Uncharacterized protein n=1 Tax=Bradyrhizobium yuanmingense TaxID=108015 RepID=A0A1C3VZS8_9BRAD|nr:hypothetical protein [Bradyrhizobium yuanmingense]TWI27779.1 hypothetical protein IQ15_03319 [Bradyrhizobium yuanmingense]SCB33280.1 hypothetical protein GA0061099_10055 [Bradyrhizobium yuanmingense]
MAVRISAGLAIQQQQREASRLIAFLDASDPYVMTEREEAVDDVACDTDELELSEGDDEDGGDEEPSLGSATGWGGSPDNQEGWASGSRDDREDEHDGREPDESGIADMEGLLEQVGSQSWQLDGYV